MTLKAFGQALYRLRPNNIEERQRTVGGKVVWCYIGIGLSQQDASTSRDSQDSRDSRDSPLSIARTREVKTPGGI